MLPIPFADGYFIDQKGNVFSSRLNRFKKLKSHPDGDGYARVVLKCDNGKLKTFKVAILVLTTFRGNKPVGFQSSHLDGNIKNDSLANLIWETPAENLFRRRAHGTFPKHESHPSAKLNWPKVKAIRQLIKRGVKQLTIAKLFNISDHTVTDIKQQKTWNA